MTSCLKMVLLFFQGVVSPTPPPVSNQLIADNGNFYITDSGDDLITD